MKKISYTILIITVVLSLASCSSEFLERDPAQSLLDSDFLLTLNDYETAINGVHNQLQNPSTYGRYFVLVPDVMGEDVKQADDANRAKEWAEYEGDRSDFIPEDIWREFYEAINICNHIINSGKYQPIPEDQEDFDHIIGQAYALRALAHFNLTSLYGQHYTFTADASHLGVPIVLEYNPEALPSRNTVFEVYNQVISDFTMGINLMNDNHKATYMSKLAAQALLSRVYLYQEDFDNAISMSSQVIASSLALAEGNAYIRQFSSGNSKEAIFEIGFNDTDNPGSDHLGGMYRASGYGDYFPAQDLFDLIPDGDLRKTITDDETLPGMFLKDASNDIRVNKYPTFGPTLGTDVIPVIRLSEVYLNRAEARAKANVPDETGAQQDLNMIRKRGLATAPDVIETGAALIDEILKERRIELCFEGHRIFDATRNKQGIVRNDCTSNICTITYPNDRFILPIPDGETDVNLNIEQNTGY